MKKLVSVVLALAMLVSMFTTVSAKTIGEMIPSQDVPFLKYDLPIEVLARRSGTSDEYSKSLGISSEGLLNGVGVDYKATLDMEDIRILFDNTFITHVLAGDPQAEEEFSKGKVSTEVKVTVSYPGVTVSDVENAGSLVSDNKDLFEESKAREVGTDTVTITYKNIDSLTVADLSKGNLCDVVFELNNAALYTSEGHHKINITMEGRTTVDFETKDLVVDYEGSGSYVVSAVTAHVLKVIPAVPATCYETGLTEGVMCVTHDCFEGCGAHGLQPQESTSKLNHKDSIKLVEAKTASCTQSGNKAHYVCLLCKDIFSDASANNKYNDRSEIVIPKTDHSLVDDNNKIEATCTKDGLTAGKHCTECGYITTRKVILANGHTEVQIAAVAATCTENGSTEGKKCSVCGEVLVAPVEIEKTGHKYDNNWQTEIEATENNEGSKYRVCTVCGEGKETVIIPKKEHVCSASAELITKAATCTEPGSKQKYCACGKTFGEPEVIDALGHTTTQVAGKEANCTDKGIIEHYACSVCGGLFRDAAGNKPIKSAEIPVDKHKHPTGNLRELPAVAATCEKDGLTKGTKCTKCNTVIEGQEQKKIPKLSEYPELNYQRVPGKPATCNEDGIIEHWHCSICDNDYSIHEVALLDNCVIPKKGHAWGDVVVIKESTETEKGEGKRTCDNDPEHEITVELALAQHKHNEECEEILLYPTCTVPGKKVMRFTCCGTIDTTYPDADENGIIIIPAKHDFIIIDIPSTCFKEGTEKHNYCRVCDKAFDIETGAEITNLKTLKIDKLEHVFEFHHDNNNFTFNKCKLCNEMVKIPKENKAKTKGHGGIKDEAEQIKEERVNEEKKETGREVVVESVITINERNISEELETDIHKNDTANKKASTDKVVLDITVETVTTHIKFEDNNNDNENDLNLENSENIIDKDTKVHKETPSLIEIEIPIPFEMRGFVDFLVHRMHEGTPQVLTTNPDDNDGEYIVIAPDKSTLTIFVKKFSEYAVVGYDTKVNPDPVTPPTSGGSSSCTIKLNANGGTLLNNVTVKRGQKAELPVPTRSGYVFAGWYLDNNFTTPFDADTVINRNYTLYAKWVAVGECEGTITDNCPCLKYTDLDPSLWYHVGVDYVLNRGMMIGVSNSKFAPSTNVTRAMLVTVLWRSEGKPAAGNTTFTDLEDGQYYVDAVKWASANGVVNGYSDTTFAPNAAITREQFAAIMYRYAKAKGYDVSVGENTNILSYTDYSKISEYAIEAMQYTLGSGLIKGRTETTLNPKDNTTRAEMATILYRFFTESK